MKMSNISHRAKPQCIAIWPTQWHKEWTLLLSCTFCVSLMLSPREYEIRHKIDFYWLQKCGATVRKIGEVGKKKNFHRIKSSISNKYRLSHAGGPARRTALCALCCTHKWTLSVTKYRGLSDETSTVARSCQLSSTVDGRQFITPSFHLCRTKLATRCDDRRAAANFCLCPKSGIKLNLLPFCGKHAFPYNTV